LDTARQAIRWGIPGWLFILTLFFFNFLYRFVENAKSYNFSLWLALKTYFDIGTGIVALIGVLGIPIGYIIYQIYFTYLRSISSDDQYYHMECLLKGYNKSQDYQNFINDWNNLEKCEQAEEFKATFFSRFFKNIYRGSTKILKCIFNFKKINTIDTLRREIYEKEIKWSWVDIDVLKSDPKFHDLKQRQQYLSDIYHSLGATRISIILAYLIHMCIVIKDIILIYTGNIQIDLRKAIILIAVSITPLIIILLSTYVCELNRKNILIHKFVILRSILGVTEPTTIQEIDENERKEQEALIKLSGIRIFYYLSLFFYLIIVLILYFSLLKSNHIYFPVILVLGAILYLIPLIGLYQKKSFTINYTRVILILNAIFFPIGTITTLVLWKRINDAVVKGYLCKN
jgi:hypothetical protein